MKKTLLSMAITASLGLASASASAYNASVDAQDVTIQEDAIAGASAHVIVADQLDGNYSELFSVTGANTFNTLAYFNAGGWYNNGAAVGSQLNYFLGNGYGLYATFQSSGSFSVSAGGVSFSGGAGTIQLWADANSDTTKTLPGTAFGKTIADIALGNNSDDRLLGSASLLTFGNGSVTTGQGANGNFELVFGDWLLANPDGENYFIAPRPFYMVLDLNGNFQEFNPNANPDTLMPMSSANAFFTKVPEPASIALLGLGLLGLGMSRRRKV